MREGKPSHDLDEGLLIVSIGEQFPEFWFSLPGLLPLSCWG